MNYINEIVYRSCEIKKEVVEQDEKEKNLRMILNFGHTIGHAIEQYYNFEKYYGHRQDIYKALLLFLLFLNPQKDFQKTLREHPHQL